eukprot:TRINITY_DN27846_c0_g1_i1.p1 TRINITY_DN27846_c0_g1~~TRINITY_DN27846_c0_g1_i1.p1  ORF type:complete len:489 (-),score=88.28 TRINITY_DN27846_c0_g1_i1:48-1514(-)
MPPQPSCIAALAVLGLDWRGGVTQDCVKKRFKDLALRYHPDKVNSRGGDEDEAKEATSRFQRISQAYAALLKDPYFCKAQTNAPKSVSPTASAFRPKPPQASASTQREAPPPKGNTQSGVSGSAGAPGRPAARPSETNWWDLFNDAQDTLRKGAPSPRAGNTARVSPQKTSMQGSRRPQDNGPNVRSGHHTVCSSCSGRNGPMLTKSDADSLGFRWVEYIRHPDGLKTCMICKLMKKSVVSEESVFEDFTELRFQPQILFALRQQNRSFEDVRGAAFYWRQDLQRAAKQVSLGGDQVASAATRLFEAFAAAAKPSSECSPLRRGRPRRLPSDEFETPTLKRSRTNPATKASGTNSSVVIDLDSATASVESGTDAATKACGTNSSAAVDVDDSARSVASRNGPWNYRVIGDKKVGIREEAGVEASTSKHGHIAAGAVFSVSERVLKEDGRLYLRLADGRGWTYDRSAKDFDKVVVAEVGSTEEKRHQGA